MTNLSIYLCGVPPLRSCPLIYDVVQAVFSPAETLIPALLYVSRQHKKLLSQSKRIRMGRDSWPLTWNHTWRENRTGWRGRPNSLWQLWSHLPHQLLFSQPSHMNAPPLQPLSALSRSLSLTSMLVWMDCTVFALSHHLNGIWGYSPFKSGRVALRVGGGICLLR